MCGAFVLHHNRVDIARRFQVDEPPDEIAPRYKISPSEQIEIVLMGVGHHRSLDLAQWGLVPFWAKDPSIGRKMFNARAETVSEKPAYRSAVKGRRCLIPADGFYEWDRRTRQPMYFKRADDGLFGFAGLWEDWNDGDSKLRTCTLITTEANRTVGAIHDRMPVIVHPEQESVWLGESENNGGSMPKDALADILRPFPDELMTGYGVSPRINYRGNHGSDAIEPVSAQPPAVNPTLPF